MQTSHREGSTNVCSQNQVRSYGAWAAMAPMSAMLSPFWRDGTALMCKMTPETGARVPGKVADTGARSRQRYVSGRRRRAVALASVRRPNGTYGLPVCSFHEDSDMPRCKRRNQPDQVHKPILAVQRCDGKLLPPIITPTLKSMRPDPSHDPAVEDCPSPRCSRGSYYWCSYLETGFEEIV